MRVIDTFELAKLWREAMPPLPGQKMLTIQDSLFGSEREDGDISFKLVGHDYRTIELATELLKTELEQLAGVGDVNDSRDTNAKEVQFKLKPLAYSLGLTVTDIARQMSFSLYGYEAQRLLRNTEEIKVMVRYPEYQRNAISHVSTILIHTADGTEIPLSELAHITITEGVNQIRRENTQRSVNVWGSVDKDIITPVEIKKLVDEEIRPKIDKLYPNITTETAGQLKRELESGQEQNRDMIITLMIIYILLAVPLKSYVQPLIIMSVIPFGIIGAIIGHLVLRMDMSSLSIFGIIAASGVVINDSLVMVDYINKAKAQGVKLHQAVVDAGSRRFRAIILTSLTTFIGLIPIILEPSMQAKIVIPMAVSLAFGVLFATIVTLLLIPCLYIIGNDVKQQAIRVFQTQIKSNQKT